jgi:hypothetical protein
MDNGIKPRINKSLIQVDPEELFTGIPEPMDFDLADGLWQGLVLKEDVFRSYLEDFDFAVFSEKDVAIHCSADAIVPTWASMLVASKITMAGGTPYLSGISGLKEILQLKFIAELSLENYENARIVIKGCSSVPESVYTSLTFRLQSVAKTILFGEPCSTVPVFKAKK